MEEEYKEIIEIGVSNCSKGGDCKMTKEEYEGYYGRFVLDVKERLGLDEEKEQLFRKICKLYGIDWKLGTKEAPIRVYWRVKKEDELSYDDAYTMKAAELMRDELIEADFIDVEIIVK